MRLFWKLFCSMVVITALACALGGYILIDSQFRPSLDREVSAVYEENDLLRYTLARELGNQMITAQDELAQAQGERTYLHAASPLLFGEETFYLENCW